MKKKSVNTAEEVDGMDSYAPGKFCNAYQPKISPKIFIDILNEKDLSICAVLVWEMLLFPE